MFYIFLSHKLSKCLSRRRAEWISWSIGRRDIDGCGQHLSGCCVWDNDWVRVHQYWRGFASFSSRFVGLDLSAESELIGHVFNGTKHTRFVGVTVRSSHSTGAVTRFLAHQFCAKIVGCFVTETVWLWWIIDRL